MKKILIFLIICSASLSLFAQKLPRTEVYRTKDGSSLTFHFFGHASLAIEVKGKFIYFDPTNQFADYTKEPKADAIFITHSHGDHLDAKAIAALSTAKTSVWADSTSAKILALKHLIIMKPGKKTVLWKNINVEAVPAYNITKEHLQFHPKSRKDCGYVLTIGGSRIYVAGDTENTTEMKALQNIDVAFLPVNQPYTMTVDEAVDAVRAMRPAVFYPYHYGGVKEVTDIGRLTREAKKYTEVRLRGME